MTYLITILTIFSSVIGFVIQATLARKFGVGLDMDLYLLALSAPLFALAVVTSAYAYGVVPQLVGNNNEVNRIELNQGLILFGLMFSSLFVLLSFFVDFQIYLYSTSKMTILDEHRILFKLAWFLGACQIMLVTFGTILTAEKRFLTSISLQQSPQVGLLLVLLFITDQQGIAYLIIGSLFGCFIGLSFSLLAISRYFSQITKLSLKNLSLRMKKIISTAFFGAVASSVFGVVMIVDAIMAPFEGVGVLTTLAYAQKIVIGFGNIAVIGVFTIAAPQLKEILVAKGPAGFADHVRELVSYSLPLSLLVAIGLYFFTSEFLTLFFLSEIFLSSDVSSVTSVVRAMLPGMIAMLMSSVLFKALFCLDKIAKVSIALGITWPLIYYIGIKLLPGIGAIKFSYSYSIAWITTFIFITFYLVSRVRQELYKVKA